MLVYQFIQRVHIHISYPHKSLYMSMAELCHAAPYSSSSEQNLVDSKTQAKKADAVLKQEAPSDSWGKDDLSGST